MSGGNTSIQQTFLGLAVSRTVASVPSMLGAAFIIQHILRSSRRRLIGAPPPTTTARRHQQNDIPTLDKIMLGMSAVNFLYACVNVLSSVPALQEFASVYVLAKGNWATCEASGFLGQFASITSVLYNASLTVYYMLTILQDQPRARAGRVRQRRQQRQHSRYTTITKIEPLMHFVPIVIGLTTAVVPLPLDLNNPTPLSCTIVSFPLNCGTNNIPCVRGGNAQTLYIPLVALWVWSTFAFMTIAMTIIYVKIA